MSSEKISNGKIDFIASVDLANLFNNEAYVSIMATNDLFPGELALCGNCIHYNGKGCPLVDVLVSSDRDGSDCVKKKRFRKRS